MIAADTATGVDVRSPPGFLLYWIGTGLVVFILGLFFLSSRSGYMHLVEAFFLLPGLILMLTPWGRRMVLQLLPHFLPLFLLLAYAALRALLDWEYEHYHSLIYILEAALFCITLVLLFHGNRHYLESLLFLSCLAAAALSLAHIFYFYAVMGYPLNAPLLDGVRVAGLRNPLEVGMIATTLFFLLLGFQLRQGVPRWRQICGWLALAAILLFILFMQRRTAYVAVGGGLFIATWLTGHRLAKYALAALAIGGLALFFIMPEAFTNRGFSYRPQIWTSTLEQSREALLFGHGILADAVTWENGEIIGVHSHNIHLGMLYSLGVVGLLLWLLVWAPTAIYALAKRAPIELAVYILPLFSAIIYGCFELSTGFTRINERWFVIWLPISLMLCYRLALTPPLSRPAKHA